MRQTTRADFRYAQSGGDAANAHAPRIDECLAKIATTNPDPQLGGIRDHARHELCGPLVHAVNV
jgi:hypothetical protein